MQLARLMDSLAYTPMPIDITLAHTAKLYIFKSGFTVGAYTVFACTAEADFRFSDACTVDAYIVFPYPVDAFTVGACTVNAHTVRTYNLFAYKGYTLSWPQRFGHFGAEPPSNLVV